MASLPIVLRPYLWAILVVVLGLLPAAAQPALTGTDLELIGPPDLTSPRSTLEGLKTSVDKAYDILSAAFDEYVADPGFFESPEVSRQVRIADLLLRRAMATLDLSQVPLVNRYRTGLEVVILLKEILERLPAIDPATVPDSAVVKADGLTAWTLPYTNLEIVKADSGPNAGKFVFSAGSVAGAHELYDAVSAYGGRAEAGTDLYRFYTLTPGGLLPPKWFFWLQSLPSWALEPIFLGHALWQLAGVLITVVVLFGGWWLVVHLLRRRVAAAAATRRFLPRLVPPLLLIAVALLAKWVVIEQINVSGPVLFVAGTVLQAVVYLAAAWTAYLVCAAIGEQIASSSRIDRASIDASLIRVAARVAGIAAGITIIFVGATDVGLPVYGVIAGLGVGGLALGLAARPTLENLIGGFILYADRPVRVGEYCQFGDKFGTVEEIGIRSTRVRARDGTLITIPNAEFSNMALVNFTRRERMLLDTTIGLRYETTPEQMQAILDGIRSLLAANPEVIPDTIRVRFKELGGYSLGIGIRVSIKGASISKFLEVQEGILFGIREAHRRRGRRDRLPVDDALCRRPRPRHIPAGRRRPGRRLDAAGQVAAWATACCGKRADGTMRLQPFVAPGQAGT